MGREHKTNTRHFILMIYIIRNSHNGLVKIGKADNPQQRLSALQTGNDSLLAIEAIGRGSYALETHLHWRLAKYRRRGEWFALRPWHVAWAKRMVGARVPWWWRWLPAW
jgi:hypothetical protein